MSVEEYCQKYPSTMGCHEAPILITPVNDQSAVVNELFSANLGLYFRDPQGSPMAFQLTGLPPNSGLKLSPGSGTLQGVPTLMAHALSPIPLTITAKNSYGLGTSDDFTLTVVECVENRDCPTGYCSENTCLPFRTEGESCSPQQPCDESLSCENIPGGFTCVNGMLPLLACVQSLLLIFIYLFILYILFYKKNLTTAVMNKPVVLNPIPNQEAASGVPFYLDITQFFSSPSTTPLTYTMTGLPSGSGLSFNSEAGVLNGKPNAADVSASPMRMAATAIDAGDKNP